MAAYIVQYDTDAREGSSLRKTSKTQGWVEYLNTLGQVYYIPYLYNDYYQHQRRGLMANVHGYLDKASKSHYIGWIQHLAQQRLNNKFVLPVFGIINPKTKALIVQCGSSRINASILCGVSPKEIPVIAFVHAGQDAPPGAEPLTSTQQFNDLFGISTIDYRISFNEIDNNVLFLNSILKYTIYDDDDQVSIHSATSDECKRFWEKFCHETKYKIQIHCTAQSRAHVIESSIFDVEYIEKKPQDWELSYGMMLGAFNDQLRTKHATHKLQLWLYDVTEPVNLELMIPWMNERHNFYKTQNEKAVIIDGFYKSNGMQIIGNWLK
jgi:hypothetical protein